jgi:hypothetical protein
MLITKSFPNRAIKRRVSIHSVGAKKPALQRRLCGCFEYGIVDQMNLMERNTPQNSSRIIPQFGAGKSIDLIDADHDEHPSVAVDANSLTTAWNAHLRHRNHRFTVRAQVKAICSLYRIASPDGQWMRTAPAALLDHLRAQRHFIPTHKTRSQLTPNEVPRGYFSVLPGSHKCRNVC